MSARMPGALGLVTASRPIAFAIGGEVREVGEEAEGGTLIALWNATALVTTPCELEHDG